MVSIIFFLLGQIHIISVIKCAMHTKCWAENVKERDHFRYVGGINNIKEILKRC
jgi:hypothetical protein